MDIPEDVVNEILGYVGHNEQVLRVLSRVCGMFVGPCQRVLFSNITLRPSGPSRTWPTSARLHAVLSSSPRLVGYVKCIHLKPDSTTRQCLALRDDESLTRCLALLTHLKAFTIQCHLLSEWSTSSDDLRSEIVRILHLPTLECVHLVGSPLTMIIDHCITIKHLSLVQPSIRSPIHLNRHTRPSLRKTQLETLLLHLPPGAKGCLKAFTLHEDGAFDLSRLRRLHMKKLFTNGVDAEEMRELLNSCSESLEELTLDLNYKDDNPPDKQRMLDAITLQSLVSLRFLRISIGVRAQNIQDILEWLQILILTMPPTAPLEEVIIISTFLGGDSQTGVWCDAVRLLSKTIPSIRKIQLLVQPIDLAWLDMDKLITDVTKNLKDLIKKGVFEVDDAVDASWRMGVLPPFSQWDRTLNV